MSAALRTPEYLQHILQAIARIDEYTCGIDESGFLQSTLVQDAVIRNIEIIGEACNRISRDDPDFTRTHAHVPWRFAIGMRNVLSHGYFKVDLQAVWQTVQRDLPTLDRQIQDIAHLG